MRDKGWNQIDPFLEYDMRAATIVNAEWRTRLGLAFVFVIFQRSDFITMTGAIIFNAWNAAQIQ